MFAIPIAAAILDRKKRKKGPGPEVLAEPIFFPETEFEKDAKPASNPVPRPVPKPAPRPVRRPEEGTRAVEKRSVKAKIDNKTEEEEGLKIDPKMLIIYSEILKPKFDE